MTEEADGKKASCCPLQSLSEQTIMIVKLRVLLLYELRPAKSIKEIYRCHTYKLQLRDVAR